MNELAIFANDIAMLDNEYRMSLKSITDRLKVRHDKALLKVEEMAEDPAFGTMSKMDIVYNDKGQTTKTYALNKRQSIAVAARLNTEFLMLIIDRWQELEDAEAQRQQAALALAQQEAQVQAQLADEAQMKLQNTVFQISVSKDFNRAELSDWKHRFEPLRCSYLGVPNKWGDTYKPKEAVAALGDYVDEALDLIRTALQFRPALVFALKQSGIGSEVAYKVADNMQRYARKQRKREEAEGRTG